MSYYRVVSLALCLWLTGCAQREVREPVGSSAELSSVTVTSARRDPTPPGWSKSYLKNADRFLAAVYEQYPFEVFCGCDASPRTKKIDLRRCGFEPQKPHSTTNTKMQWEHVFPKSWMHKAMGCSNRNECLDDQNYVDAETDLYNLVPSIGSLNATRGDRWLWEIPGEAREYGQCDFERATIGGDTVIEPPDSHKGNVARIILYYIERHSVDLDDYVIELYLSWHRDDPVDAAELRRAAMIEQIVGYPNPWITGDR